MATYAAAPYSEYLTVYFVVATGKILHHNKRSRAREESASTDRESYSKTNCDRSIKYRKDFASSTVGKIRGLKSLKCFLTYTAIVIKLSSRTMPIILLFRCSTKTFSAPRHESRFQRRLRKATKVTIIVINIACVGVTVSNRIIILTNYYL